MLKPLVTFDRALNRLLGGSFNETLSARMHRRRLAGKPRLADAIDVLFFWQVDHCQHSFDRWIPKV